MMWTKRQHFLDCVVLLVAGAGLVDSLDLIISESSDATTTDTANPEVVPIAASLGGLVILVALAFLVRRLTKNANTVATYESGELADHFDEGEFEVLETTPMLATRIVISADV
jgi:hypothetical protein